MIDPLLVRERPADVEARLRSRGMDPSADLAELTGLEAERRRLIPLVENLKREQNAAGEQVAQAKREGRDPSGIFAENKARAGRIREMETELGAVEQRRDARLLTLPNLPHETVPAGKSAGGQRRSPALGNAAGDGLRAEAALGAGSRARDP